MTQQAPIVAIGIDPGAKAGIAAVAWTGKGRPELVAVAGVRVPSPAQNHRRWIRAAMVAVADVWAAVEQLDPGPEVVPIWVEQAPPTATSTARRRHQVGGMAAWLSLGAYQGRLEAITVGVTGEEIQRVEQGRWVRLHSRRAVRLRKMDLPGHPQEGWHRIAEAAFVVDGAGEALERWSLSSVKADQKLAVDISEAVLIAAAGCLAQFSGGRSAA